MVAFVLAAGCTRLIGSGACRVARVYLSGCCAFRARSLRGKTRLLGDRPTGVLHWYARIGAGREWH